MSVTLADAKSYLGIASDDCQDDYRLAMIINAARDTVEEYLEVPLVQRALTQKFGSERVWQLDGMPIASITSILDPAGNEIESDRYLLVEELGLICHYGFPPRAVKSNGQADRWTVTYVAGHFAHENMMPHGLKLGILKLVAHDYHIVLPGVQSQRTADSSVALIPNPTAREILMRDITNRISNLRRKHV